MNGEKLSEVEVKATLYCDELAYTISDHSYCMDQIFNTIETSLNYKMLPNFTCLIFNLKDDFSTIHYS